MKQLFTSSLWHFLWHHWRWCDQRVFSPPPAMWNVMAPIHRQQRDSCSVCRVCVVEIINQAIFPCGHTKECSLMSLDERFSTRGKWDVDKKKKKEKREEEQSEVKSDMSTASPHFSGVPLAGEKTECAPRDVTSLCIQFVTGQTYTAVHKDKLQTYCNPSLSLNKQRAVA